MIRINILSAAFMLIFNTSSYAQAPDTLWTRTYGGVNEDKSFSVQQTSDGGYIIAGETKSFGEGNFDIYLIKTDANGDTLWTRTYGGAELEHGRSVQQTSDGGYIVAGTSYPSVEGESDIYLIKTDINGDSVWTRKYGGANSESGRSVQQTSDGGYVVTGYTASFNFIDVYLLKTDANGDTLWTRTYDRPAVGMGKSVQQTSDDGYIIAGHTDPYGEVESDLYLIKTDTNGDTLWTRTYGGSGSESGSSVQQTSDGGYIVTGSTWSFGEGELDLYLIKTDTNGDSLWTKTYGGSGIDYGSSVQQVPDGGYIVTGYTDSFGDSRNDVFLIRTGVSGDTIWTQTYGGLDLDYGSSVQQTSDGGYIIAGSTYSFGEGGGDVYLIRLAPDQTDIKDDDDLLPPSFSLQQNYPNPFNALTEIRYSLSQACNVTISIYNIIGQKVYQIYRTHKAAGEYSLNWGASNKVSGIYFARMEAGGRFESIKMVLLK